MNSIPTVKSLLRGMGCKKLRSLAQVMAAICMVSTASTAVAADTANRPMVDAAALVAKGRAAFTPALAGAGPLNLQWHLDKLTSGENRPETYKILNPGPSSDVRTEVKAQPLGDNAIQLNFTFTNQGKDRQLLRSVLEVPVPFTKFEWWNGYANNITDKFDPQDDFLSRWFPVNAALGNGVGVSNGVNPSEVYSRVDSTRTQRDNASILSIALPFVLDAGESFTLSHVVTAFPNHFGYRDAIQNYYDLFPDAYKSADGIDPRVISTELAYLAWSPGNYGLTDPTDMIRRYTGGQGGWEWCYGDAVRNGDWANTDQWTVGWNNPFPRGPRRGMWTKERLEKFRQNIKARLAATLRYNAAPMYYVNVMYIEKTLVEEHFPNIIFDRTQTTPQGQYCLISAYTGGNAYGKLFAQGLTDIAQQYTSARGVGFDSVFGHRVIGTQVNGVEQTSRRSFVEGKIVAIEGAGSAALLDLNRSHTIDGVRSANAVNYKLVSPYFIGARTDSALYEGSAMTRPERLNRIEAMRARLGSQKTLSWHKHSLPQQLTWVQWDRLDAADMLKAYEQIETDELLLSYLWGATPAPMMPAIGIERTFKAIPELIQLTKLGWQPSPLVHVKGDVVAVRYGQGLGSNIVLINPGFQKQEVTLEFDARDWDGYLPLPAQVHGGKVTSTLRNDKTVRSTQVQLTVPARDISRLVILGRVKLDQPLTGPLTVGVDAGRGDEGNLTYEVRLQGIDPVTLPIELAGNPAYPSSQVTMLGKKTNVSAAHDVQIQIAADGWVVDFQSSDENVRRAVFYLDQYAPVQMGVTSESLKKMNWGQAADHPLPVIVATDPSLKESASLLADWFASYTAYMGKEIRPQVVAETPSESPVPPIILSIKKDLDPGHDGVAIVRNDPPRGLELAGKDARSVREGVDALLLVMDQAYPYVGKLSDKDPYLKVMGLAGGVLKPTADPSAQKAVGPTLDQRLKSIGLLSD